MPELPDVEGFRREAAEHVTGQRIETVRVEDPQVVRWVSAQRVPEILGGRYAGVPQRQGKWLLVPTAASRGGNEDVPTVLFHFGMTGSLRWCSPEAERHRHERVVFVFSGGELRYVDMRKLKGIHVACQRSEVCSLLDELGPDAGAVTQRQLRSSLTGTSRQLKAALMDQAVLAGLGNLCVDEILWRVRIHPKRTTKNLREDDWPVLHHGMRSMLRQSTRQGQVPGWPSWLTGHRDEPDGRCPRCATRLRRGTVASRSTVWCPICQVLPGAS